jgi:hypothetical protein
VLTLTRKQLSVVKQVRLDAETLTKIDELSVRYRLDKKGGKTNVSLTIRTIVYQLHDLCFHATTQKDGT